MSKTLTVEQHYDLLAESGHCSGDSPSMQEYMARWDGNTFWEAVGTLAGKAVLEVGIGEGRLALRAIECGCSQLTGLDVSSRALEKAGACLGNDANLELVQADICDFVREDTFDVAYSVLTFEHVKDKLRALQNIHTCLRSGGHFVLSINLEKYCDEEGTEGWLDFGSHKVQLHQERPELYASCADELGFEIDRWVDLRDTFVSPRGKKSETYGQVVAALLSMRKQ